MSTSATTSTPSTSATSLTAPSTFTGVSNYATSLQQVLTRAVGIASLPLDSLQAGLTDLTTKQTAVQSLDSTFLALQNDVNSIQYAVINSLLTATVADPTIARADVRPGATAGTYSLEVDNLGAYSTAISTAGSTAVTNPATQGITASSTLTLSVGTTHITITPASSDLLDLATAINAQAGGQAQASVVNIGSTGSPDYRLSLTAASLGTGAIALTDSSSASLISNSTPGALASYIVDGSSGTLTSTSRTITLSPGVTVNLLGQSTLGHATAITVADDPASLASAFSQFVTDYNAAANALTAQHGSSAGPLQGNSLLQPLGSVLSQLGTYSNGTPASALANFGIKVDETGQLSINTGTFTSTANADFPALLATLGSATTSGFLQTATNLLGGVESAKGLVPQEEASIASQITAQQTQIAAEQATVSQLQTYLTAQISQADSTIAALESQVSFVTGLFATYTGATNTQSNGLNKL